MTELAKIIHPQKKRLSIKDSRQPKNPKKLSSKNLFRFLILSRQESTQK